MGLRGTKPNGWTLLPRLKNFTSSTVKQAPMLLCLGPKFILRVKSERTFKCLAVLINHQSVQMEPFTWLQQLSRFLAAQLETQDLMHHLCKSFCCQSFSFKHKICFGGFFFYINMWRTGLNFVWWKCKSCTAHRYSNTHSIHDLVYSSVEVAFFFFY